MSLLRNNSESSRRCIQRIYHKGWHCYYFNQPICKFILIPVVSNLLCGYGFSSFKASLSARAEILMWKHYPLPSQQVANMIRFLVDSYNKPVPAILEIPSKDHPYDPAHDSVLSRVKYLFSAESVASGRRWAHQYASSFSGCKRNKLMVYMLPLCGKPLYVYVIYWLLSDNSYAFFLDSFCGYFLTYWFDLDSCYYHLMGIKWDMKRVSSLSFPLNCLAVCRIF